MDDLGPACRQVGLVVMDFTESDAERAAELWPLTADKACRWLTGRASRWHNDLRCPPSLLTGVGPK